MHDNAGDIVKVFGIDRVSAAQPAYFAAGSDAYAPALAVYQFTKLHHETKGALEDSLNDLGRRFAHQGKRATPAPSSPTPEDPPV